MSNMNKRFFRVLFAFVVVLLLVCSRNVSRSQSAITSPQTNYILIDPGHGGGDSGALSADGVMEKSINLHIAVNLRDVLHLFGYPTRMTRESDISIHDPSCTTARQIKVSDMNNRLQLYRSASMTLSIHQNHFSVAKYHGAQLFYSPNNPNSRVLADSIRSNILSYLQTDNHRELKQATEDIFLLHKTTTPAVLVECGFLSNPTECKTLQDAVYQQQMAMLIAAGTIDVYQIDEE